MSALRNPLVLIPQNFGCLVFDRRTSRYLPFDVEATTLLQRLTRDGIDPVLTDLDGKEHAAVLAFCDHFYERGFFDLRGRLMADTSPVGRQPSLPGLS